MGKPKQPKEKDQAKVPTAGTGDANNEGTTNEGESSHAKYGLRINQFKAKSQIVFPTLDLDGVLVVLAENDSDHVRLFFRFDSRIHRDDLRRHLRGALIHLNLF